MVDIHCHILPALDDGAPSMEIARQMADMAVEDGITHIIGTPHADDSYQFVPELIKQRRDELQAAYEGRLTFATGCDFHLSFENLEAVQKDSRRFTLNQKNYLLVEFSDYSIPAALDEALHRLQVAGLHPIVTHPERNPLIRTNPDRLYQWIRQGCYVQLTAQSVLGKFGKSAQEWSQRWLAAGAVHFIASDAHNVSSRPLRLKNAFDEIAHVYGEERARALLIENPRAAFEGRPLPYMPELALEDGVEDEPVRRRKRFLFF